MATKVLLFLAVVVVVGLLVLDQHGPPRNCTWYYEHDVGGGYIARCIAHGQQPPAFATTTP